MGGYGYSVLQYDELFPADMTGDVMTSCDMIVSQHDRYVYDSYASERVSIGSICDICAQHLREAAVFGSMLSEQSSEYALVSHSHTQYSRNSIQACAYDIPIGNFFLDGGLYTIGISNKYQQQVQRLDDATDESRIGMLKFVSVGTLGAIDTAAEDFDGWVYPNGATYKVVDFKHGTRCKTLFGSPASDSARFKVPTLNGFIRISDNATTQVDGHTSIKPHTHNVSFDLSAENIDAEIQVKEAKKSGKISGDGNCITQRRKTNPFDVEAKISLTGYITTSNSVNIMLVSGGTSALASTPSYVDTPVMIYIGGRA